METIFIGIAIYYSHQSSEFEGIVDTNHQTPEQHHFLRKLLGFQFVIEYKPGKENYAADSLSRVYDVEDRAAISTIFTTMSQPEFVFLEVLFH